MLTGDLVHIKFVNFHGQKYARLNADAYVFGEDHWEDNAILKIMNVLLFRSPKSHVLRLQRVWPDRIIIQPRWKDFVTRMTNELNRSTIFVRLVYFSSSPCLTKSSRQ